MGEILGATQPVREIPPSTPEAPCNSLIQSSPAEVIAAHPSSSSALIDTVVEYRRALRNLILSAQEAVWLLNLLDLRDHNCTARVTLQNAIREAAEVLK